MMLKGGIHSMHTIYIYLHLPSQGGLVMLKGGIHSIHTIYIHIKMNK